MAKKMSVKIIRTIESFGEAGIQGLAPLSNVEMSEAQENRVVSLISLMSKGFKGDVDFDFICEIAELFLSATKGKDKDRVKVVFRSFTNIPRFPMNGLKEVRPKIYKKLNSEEKERYCGGRGTLLDELFCKLKNRSEKFDRYISILKRAKASK